MTQPAPGTLAEGNLYVDAQSKQVWYGVPAGIDATQSILLSDIVAEYAAIAAAQAAAAVYTDGQVALRALLAHTHAISDVTGLAAALAAAQGVPAGCILMWSGAIVNIPAGWVICDGTNGTPNLLDRFIVGAGNTYNVGNTGGAISYAGLTSSNNGHSHGGVTGSHVLTLPETPAHIHLVNDSGHTHTLTDPGHHHDFPGKTAADLVNGGESFAYAADATRTTFDAVTGVTAQSAITGISLQSAGGGGGHTHTIATEPAHDHTIGVPTRPPYYALAYIQKLP